MKVVILFLMVSFSTLAFNVIDLGNLEIEGEVRRPMINLFTNPLKVSERFKKFAHQRMLNNSNSLLKIDRFSNSNLNGFKTFEKSLLDINEVKQ